MPRKKKEEEESSSEDEEVVSSDDEAEEESEEEGSTDEEEEGFDPNKLSESSDEAAEEDTSSDEEIAEDSGDEESEGEEGEEVSSAGPLTPLAEVPNLPPPVLGATNVPLQNIPFVPPPAPKKKAPIPLMVPTGGFAPIAPAPGPLAVKPSIEQAVGLMNFGPDVIIFKDASGVERIIKGDLKVSDLLYKEPLEDPNGFKLRSDLCSKIAEKFPTMNAMSIVLISSVFVKKMMYGAVYAPDLEKRVMDVVVQL
jgi:hypothetical protein